MTAARSLAKDMYIFKRTRNLKGSFDEIYTIFTSEFCIRIPFAYKSQIEEDFNSYRSYGTYGYTYDNGSGGDIRFQSLQNIHASTLKPNSASKKVMKRYNVAFTNTLGGLCSIQGKGAP